MTVIRKAIIEIETRQKRSKLEATDVGPSERAYQAEAKAAGESAKEQAASNTERERALDGTRRFSEQVSRSLGQSQASTEQYKRVSIGAFRESGEGILRLARGFALFSASTEEDTRKVLEGLIKIEATISTLKGAAKLAQVAAEFGPVGIAVAGVTALVAAGASEWASYRREIKAAAKAAEETRQILGRQGLDASAKRERGRSESAFAKIENRSRFTEAARSEGEQGKRIASEQAALQERFGKLNNAGFVPPTGTNRENVLNTERERERIAERLLELSDKQLQIDLQQLQREESEARANAIKFTIPGTNIKVNTFDEKAFQQQEDDFKRRAEKSMTTFVEVIEQAAEKIRRIEGAFN